MNIKINNKKLLNSNFYNNIILIQESDFYKVNISGKIPFKTEKLTSESFTDSIKKKNSENQLIDIVNYFLEQDKIDKLVPNNVIGYHSGTFSTVHSKNRMLAFQLNKSDELNKIPKLICNKYFNDRKLFLEENKEYKRILLTSGVYSKYEILKDNILDDFIHIQIVNSDIEFKELDKLLKNIIEEKNEKISYVWNKKYSYPTLKKDYGGIIKCGDLTINVNTDIPYKYVNNCIEEYNKNFEENKKLQLKMEGF